MKVGETIQWAVIDPETAEVLAWFSNREAARDVARHAGCRIARLLVAK